MIDFIETKDNNTIIVAIGDHGARERPIASQTNILNSSCTEKVFSDSYFLTAGIMSYFGDNELLKKYIE